MKQTDAKRAAFLGISLSTYKEWRHNYGDRAAAKLARMNTQERREYRAQPMPRLSVLLPAITALMLAWHLDG